MTDTLKNLEKLLANTEGDYALAGPADEAAIRGFSDDASIVLPADFREFLLWANGETSGSDGLCGGYRLLSIEEIREIHSEWCSEVSGEFAKQRSSTWFLGETAFYDPRWLPIAAIRPRELVLMATGDEHRYVFEWDVESGPGDVYARGFEMLIQRVADELVQDGYLELLDCLEPIQPKQQDF